MAYALDRDQLVMEQSTKHFHLVTQVDPNGCRYKRVTITWGSERGEEGFCRLSDWKFARVDQWNPWRAMPTMIVVCDFKEAMHYVQNPSKEGSPEWEGEASAWSRVCSLVDEARKCVEIDMDVFREPARSRGWRRGGVW